MNEAGRYPHDQTGELLVFERSESPSRSGREMSRVQRTPGEGQQRGEQSILHSEGRDEEQGSAIVHAAAAKRFEIQRPEHQRTDKKADMLEGMDELVAERPAVRRWQMPEPEHDAA